MENANFHTCTAFLAKMDYFVPKVDVVNSQNPEPHQEVDVGTIQKSGSASPDSRRRNTPPYDSISGAAQDPIDLRGGVFLISVIHPLHSPLCIVRRVRE